MTDNKLTALERLLEGEPPYPKGSAVRAAQDERDRLRELARQQEPPNDQR